PVLRPSQWLGSTCLVLTPSFLPRTTTACTSKCAKADPTPERTLLHMAKWSYRRLIDTSTSSSYLWRACVGLDALERSHPEVLSERRRPSLRGQQPAARHAR